MNTAAGRAQRGPSGEHGAEGGQRAAIGLALAADLLIAAVKIAGGLVTTSPSSVRGQER